MSFAPDLAAGHDGFRPEYFAQLARMEEGSFWFQARNRLLAWALHAYFPRAANLLEIGCGTGFVLAGIRRRFPSLLLCGSDVYPEGLAFAADRVPGACLFQMDATRIPYREEFDVIGAFDVLEHIEDDAAVLEQMFRATKPRGGILLTVPQHRFLWSTLDEYARHKRRYSHRELVEKVRRAGFSVVRITSFVSLLFPLLYLSRRRQRSREAGVDPAREYRLPRLANSLLGWALDCERLAISAGVSFPAGGTLVLVATRGAV